MADDFSDTIIDAIDREVLSLLRTASPDWSPADVDRMPHNRAVALALLVQSHLVEMRLHVRAWGEGTPRVVHADCIVSGRWRDVLPEEVRRAIPDFPGHVMVQPEPQFEYRLTLEGQEAQRDATRAQGPDLIGFLIAIKRVLPGRVQVRITGFGEETHEQIPTAVASSQASASVGDVDISLAPVFNIDVSKVVHPQEQTGHGRAEAPEESHPAPEATDGTKGRPLESEESDDPVDRLPNRVRRAYAQYLLAAEQYEGNAGGPPTDRQLHAWLKRHSEERLPAFETWARYLRDARQALGTQKNSPLAGREHGRSVVSCHDVEPLRRHEVD